MKKQKEANVTTTKKAGRPKNSLNKTYGVPLSELNKMFKETAIVPIPSSMKGLFTNSVKIIDISKELSPANEEKPQVSIIDFNSEKPNE